MHVAISERDADGDPPDRAEPDFGADGGDASWEGECQVDRQAAFRPPESDHPPRATSYLHGQRHRNMSAGPADELRVLARLRTVVNAKGVEVLAPAFLAEIFGECHSIRDLGLNLAASAARKQRARGKDEELELANDLFQECVFRWMDGSWNYTLDHFKADVADARPLVCVGFRLFGLQGRIRSLLSAENSRRRTRIQLESEFFESHQADLAPVQPGRGAHSRQDDAVMPDLKAPEPVSMADVFRLLQTDQAQQRLQTLVEISAARGGFGKHSAAAPEVFRLLYAKPRIPRKEVADRCNVPLHFVYQMDETEPKDRAEPYVVDRIRQHASDTAAYRELMSLCPQELFERFRHRDMAWLAHYLGEQLQALGLYSPDTPDDQACGD